MIEIMAQVHFSPAPAVGIEVVVEHSTDSL
jgi:hypothetical protein